MCRPWTLSIPSAPRRSGTGAHDHEAQAWQHEPYPAHGRRPGMDRAGGHWQRWPIGLNRPVAAAHRHGRLLPGLSVARHQHLSEEKGLTAPRAEGPCACRLAPNETARSEPGRLPWSAALARRSTAYQPLRGSRVTIWVWVWMVVCMARLRWVEGWRLVRACEHFTSAFHHAVLSSLTGHFARSRTMQSVTRSTESAPPLASLS